MKTYIKKRAVLGALLSLSVFIVQASEDITQKVLEKGAQKITGGKGDDAAVTQTGQGHVSSVKTSYGTDIDVSSIVSVVVNNCQGSDGATVSCGNNAAVTINQPGVDAAATTSGTDISRSDLRSIKNIGSIKRNSVVTFALPERSGQVTSYTFTLTDGPDAGKTIIVAFRKQASARPGFDTIVEVYLNRAGQTALVNGVRQLNFERASELFFNMKSVSRVVNQAKRKNRNARATITYSIAPDGEAILVGDDTGSVVHFNSNVE